MPTTQFGGGERVGMAPGGGNLISLNTLRSRTARTIPPRQYQNAAPLAVAIETSPKEVSFGCKMRIYCFKDIGTQIFRRKLKIYVVKMYVGKPKDSTTSYHYDIYNTFFLQHRFFCGTCVSMCRLQYVTFPGPPPHSYIGLRVPRGVLSDRCLLPNAN